MEIGKVKKPQDCIEITKMDTDYEFEEIFNWCEYLNEIFQGVNEVELLHEIVKFKKFEILRSAAVVAVIQKDRKSAKVTIESLTWPAPTQLQSLWIKGYLKAKGH